MQRINMKAFCAGLVLIGLAGCNHHLDRRDQVKFDSGDAIAANKAAQIIDPWPAAARTIDHGISGEQAEDAILRMRRSSSEKSGATPTDYKPTAAPAAAQSLR